MSAAVLAAALLATACAGSDDDDPSGTAVDGTDAPDTAGVDATDATDATDADGTDPATVSTLPRRSYRIPDPPPAPPAEEPSPPGAEETIDSILTGIEDGAFEFLTVSELGEVGDVRHAWFLADLLRFFRGDEAVQLLSAVRALTDTTISGDPDYARNPWLSVSNHLIAWDIPAYPGYREDKGGLFLLLDPRWEPFVTDEDADIDWRHVNWGGVFIDDRELGDPEPCEGGCIPALDDPAVTDAAGGDWYPDERIVFGIVEGDEALAIPLNIAEIHEMFNLTLGGRRLGIPYCTLCGSAQAYYTDETGAAEQPVLRTSGLLSRSNKVMYDLRTFSVFDTFTGAAVSGPLQDQGLVLEEVTVVRSTWAEWKRAHPDTAIIAEDGGIGRSYELDPLGDRDADGPIFPIGDFDERRPVQELVVGVITGDGTPIAFPSDAATDVLFDGGTVELGGVTLLEDGGGLRAIDAATGDELAAHEAFWFAWSQFHPDTLLWTP